MRNATRVAIVLVLVVQGVYDLALVGWLGLLQVSLASTSQAERLHALYCHCTHCPDVAKCCCVPTQHVSEDAHVRQCDPVEEGKLPNTWHCRVVETAWTGISPEREEAVSPMLPLPLSLMSARIEHPPRT